MEDERNTDNAWIETVVLHYHDAEEDSFSRLPDSEDLEWLLVSSDLLLKPQACQWIQQVF